MRENSEVVIIYPDGWLIRSHFRGFNHHFPRKPRSAKPDPHRRGGPGCDFMEIQWGFMGFHAKKIYGKYGDLERNFDDLNDLKP